VLVKQETMKWWRLKLKAEKAGYIFNTSAVLGAALQYGTSFVLGTSSTLSITSSYHYD
jgi:hypothetical protein